MGDEQRPFSMLFSGCPWVTVLALGDIDATTKAFDYLKGLGYNPEYTTPHTIYDDLRVRGCRAW